MSGGPKPLGARLPIWFGLLAATAALPNLAVAAVGGLVVLVGLADGFSPGDAGFVAFTVVLGGSGVTQLGAGLRAILRSGDPDGRVRSSVWITLVAGAAGVVAWSVAWSIASKSMRSLEDLLLGLALTLGLQPAVVVVGAWTLLRDAERQDWAARPGQWPPPTG